MDAVNGIVNSISNAIGSVTGSTGTIDVSNVSQKPVVEKPSDRAWWKSSVVYQGEFSPRIICKELC